MNFQRLLLAIQQFWDERGCVLQQPYDLEIGAGTMHPDTFFRVLGPEPWRVAYCQPSRRPVDGRYGDNPMRVYKHYQFQVVLKPAPLEIQDLYLSGKKGEAAAAVPQSYIDATTLIGPESFVRDRLVELRESGVTALDVALVGRSTSERVQTLDKLREMVETL